jgi:4-diphosphocytidyl-2-C-methyl-D-erythritol kinase
MAFADVGDVVAVQPSEAPEFEISGPFGAGLSNGDDNLVARAAQALLAGVRGPRPPFRLILDKRLPVAAGLGGGSSDAGATLRLLNEALAMGVPNAPLEAIAASLGADGAACLWGEPAIAQGRGERLSPAPAMPPLDAVLVNPGVGSSTAAVYRAFDEAGARGGADRPGLPDRFESAEDAAAWLSVCRNDLEAPAIALQPLIGEVLETLAGEPETLLARMSGSGATCFALCAGDIEAEGLAERLRSMRPGWWVRRCRLGGPW